MNNSEFVPKDANPAPTLPEVDMTFDDIRVTIKPNGKLRLAFGLDGHEIMFIETGRTLDKGDTCNVPLSGTILVVVGE